MLNFLRPNAALDNWRVSKWMSSTSDSVWHMSCDWWARARAAVMRTADGKASRQTAMDLFNHDRFLSLPERLVQTSAGGGGLTSIVPGLADVAPGTTSASEPVILGRGLSRRCRDSASKIPTLTLRSGGNQRAMSSALGKASRCRLRRRPDALGQQWMPASASSHMRVDVDLGVLDKGRKVHVRLSDRRPCQSHLLQQAQ